jgi:hypothetical protein
MIRFRTSMIAGLLLLMGSVLYGQTTIDLGTRVSGTLPASTGSLASLPRSYFTVGTGGVTANQIVSFDPSGNAIAATGTGFGGLAAATTAAAGTVEVVRSGIGTCVFDSAATVGDIAIPSTTTVGRCHDSGFSSSLLVPATTTVIGAIESAAASAGATGTIRLHGAGSFGQSASYLQGVNNLSDVSSATTSRFNLGFARFQTLYSFGDSITYGAYASSPNAGYPSWIQQAAGSTTYINQGYPSYRSQGLDPVIFNQAFTYLPATLISYTIGTNNLTADTNQQMDYQLNIEAQMAWWLVPPASKTTFQTGAVTYTGSWGNDAYIGKLTTTSGATATFTGTGTVLYLATYMSSTSTGTATLSCDGTATGATLYFSGYGAETALNAGTVLTRVSGLAPGAHTCVVTSTGTGTVTLEWAGFVSGAANTVSPYILIGGVTNQNTVVAQTITNIAAFRTSQQAAVSLFQGDGFANIGYVDTSAVGGSTNPGIYGDGSLHFNDYGYYLLAAPFIAELNTLTGTTYVEGNFIPKTIVNMAYQAPLSFCLGGSTCGNSALNGQNLSAFTGQHSVAIGASALGSATTAADDIVLGFSALTAATTANKNIALGSNAMLAVTTGAGNVAVGYDALLAATLAAGNNTAVGAWACESGAAALLQETCIGTQAGVSVTGQGNTMVGYNAANAGTALTTDSFSTFVGATSGKNTASILTNANAFGYGAQATASNQVMLGNSAVTQTVINGGILPGTLYSAAGTALPTCAVGIKGQQQAVSDATSPTYMGAYASGGAITAAVICSYNGTTYAWLTH